MRNIFPCLTRAVAAFGLVLALPAGAAEIEAESGDTIAPVVELYTSEGCSSCPPADAWISRLGETLGKGLDAVPLAFHVDYWNYLGWEDPFSQPGFTDRQRMLGALNRQRSIYTPEFLVSGRETRGTRAVVKAIQSANASDAAVKVRLVAALAGTGDIAADVRVSGDTGDSELYLAVYENDITRRIGGGENHGRTLHYDFVVRYFRRVALLGREGHMHTHTIPVEAGWNTANLGLAVLVMDRRSSGTRQALSTPLDRLFADGSG